MGSSKQPEAKSFGGSDFDREKLTKDERWAVAQHIAGSATFTKSPRLCHFLAYIAERTILGRQFEVNEQQIGVHVFERAPNYNSSEDNIVRSHARLLRKKLEEYYAAEGKNDHVRIVVPRGGYVPLFEPVHSEDRVAELPLVSLSPAKRISRTAWWSMVVAAVLLGIWVSYLKLPARLPDARFQQFWNTLLSADRDAIIVPSDTALVLYENYSGREVPLNEYVRGQFAHRGVLPPDINPKLIGSLDVLPYTNIVDLNFCWQLARRPKLDLRRTSVRSPRDLRTSDLKGVNAIFLAARRANPWVELFDKNNAFQGLFNPEDKDYVWNRTPEGTERARYLTRSPEGAGHAYAIIAFVPGLTGQENVLLLSGTSTAGTEGASDFVLSERSLGGFLARLHVSNGRIPHFELLLDVETVSASAPRAKVIASRVHGD